MDVLRPGHAHRSSSDRLLNNYLDSQKSLSTSLFTLLSHSHSSTSSLLAYVTSSPGVLLSVRRAVRHAAFEGPLSSSMTERGDHFPEHDSEGGWAAYISSLEQFRKDLKQIHLLEEELSRVKRDREILVGRLIKATKGRPTKSDLSALASTYSSHALHDAPQSSRASVLSDNSSVTSKEGKRAGKLADAQAELLGCEEHLRGLEVRIENERNRVMSRGLEERFRSMEVVGRMWVQQAKRGLEDLDKMHDLPPDAFELDSNGSLAPSQSASQIIPYDDRPPSRSGVPYPRHMQHEVAGSITGSIAEEDEDGSSSEEDPNQFVVHENRPGSQLSPRLPPKGRATPGPKSPSLGVPSVNSRARPLSNVESPGRGGRRAASDIGTGAYRPPSSRALRRTISHDEPSPRRAGSDTSSIRHRPKKKGFFASIGRLFKSKKHGSDRSSSPPYGSSRGGWQTRTDSNVKRASAFGGARGGDESSSDEDNGNLVSVSNNRNSTWTVDPTRSSGSHIKRSSTMPVANGLIPPKPTRSTSQSTITAKSKPKTTGASNVSRSNTVKSSVSEATTVKSGGTVKKKTRPNGSIARAKSPTSVNGHGQGAGVAGRNIMTLVDTSNPPVMPEVPKAPKSQVNPEMEGIKAPGSSIVTADTPLPPIKHTPSAATSVGAPALGRSVSSKSAKKKEQVKPKSSPPYRPTTPLPPSRTLSPPVKSAMRPTSPQPSSPLAPKLDLPTTPMYTISAPAPISLEEVKKEQEREKEEQERERERKREQEKEEQKSRDAKRSSFVSLQSDGASIYESAMEDGDEGYGPETDSSDDEEDAANYKMVKNDKVIRRGEMATGDPNYMKDDEEDEGSQVTIGARSEPTAIAAAPPTLGAPASAIPRRRKSVRMAVPDSPSTESHPQVHVPQAPKPIAVSTEERPRSRTPSPEPERVEQAWSTRIGRMREDTSEDEDEQDDYVRARKGLIKTNKWDAVNAAKEKTKGLKGS